ncbi:NAD(P)H-dependent oxidoreductase [Neorhizobium galegae]|uniref:NAD(P)H dehydrogenase (Quinone) n=2 Tax=Neorhizobium galegae TaxID=399 RepID=A0A068SKF4_NEOGA|nr:NAD(P)H-dependent oxidoreductase [Neorhizobium galegae]KAB1085427.1 NAD(P)H-dependent oxidoreductase [Neorhizobium galegae]CDN46627.1 NAD(P)H dehydrogenase (Quinone) [Neorhizobium galegae bv. orientalis str. HAMBI 540]
MHALIVVSHPEPGSLTHNVAAHLAEGVTMSGGSFEIADLAAEGFDPRFTQADLAAHRREEAPSADVTAEQARIDRADVLVLVYPVYWWSMPGLLKGWIDRVFANGWAYDDAEGAKVVKKLHHLPIHLVAIGGADMRTYARHGYFGAMRTQIDHGIFDYCGAPVMASELLLEEELDKPDFPSEIARKIGRNVFSTARKTEAA